MIGGNTQGIIQQKQSGVKNAIGERVDAWADIVALTGYLDYAGGESGYIKQKAKVEESTHVFLCDYTAAIGSEASDKRMVINKKTYDVLFIDDPMGMHRQIELYLRYLGGDTT